MKKIIIDFVCVHFYSKSSSCLRCPSRRGAGAAHLLAVDVVGVASCLRIFVGGLADPGFEVRT